MKKPKRPHDFDSRSKDEVSSCIALIKTKLNPEDEPEEEAMDALIGVQLVFRCQSVFLNLYAKDPMARHVAGNKRPVLEFQVIVKL